MIDEKTPNNKKKLTKKNAQTIKKQKHKTKSSSLLNLYQSKEAEAPLQCANSFVTKVT